MAFIGGTHHERGIPELVEEHRVVQREHVALTPECRKRSDDVGVVLVRGQAWLHGRRLTPATPHRIETACLDEDGDLVTPRRAGAKGVRTGAVG
jgi:hypothetical protein